jgi:hypothetical protein
MTAEDRIDSEQEFKSAIKEYCQLQDMVADAKKSVKSANDQCVSLSVKILEYMRQRNIEALRLPDESELKVRVSKRTAPLKKEQYVKLLGSLCGSEEVASQKIEELNSQREVVESYALSRTKKKKS